MSCRTCIDPATFARRFDPWGEYVKRYVPELASYPVEYIYEPWKAPLDVQRKFGCVVGKDYPERIVVHEKAVKENNRMMNRLKEDLLKQLSQVPRICIGEKNA